MSLALKAEEFALPPVLAQPMDRPVAPRRKPAARLAARLALAAALVLAILLGGWWTALVMAVPVLIAFAVLCYGAWWMRRRAGPDFFR